MLYQYQALEDLGGDPDTQPMLDNKNTAQKVISGLHAAFFHWQLERQKAGATGTKAEFARTLSAVSGRPCTPQTVSGWFSTGRMDKSWIAVIETVTGKSLGFGGVAEQAQLPGIPGTPPERLPFWPFPKIDPTKLARLSAEDIGKIEAGMLGIAFSMNADIMAAEPIARKTA